MRSVWLLVVGAWIVAAPAFAQGPPPAALPDGYRSVVPGPVVEGAPIAQPIVPDTFRFWVRAEYLAYWVKNSPLPVSLVTGDPNNPTQELLNSDRSFGAFSGFRFMFGTTLDPHNNLGLEMGFFSLQRRTRQFSAASDGAGNPILAFPYISQTPGAEGPASWFVTSPGQFAGNVWIGSSLQLGGAEANATLSLMSGGRFDLTGLVGFRYVDLRESLYIDTVSAIITTNPNTILWQSDQFRTRNQFYGGQVGGKLNWQGEYFGLDVIGKLALGSSHQTMNIQGYSAQTGPGGVNGTFPGGFFTQPSNIGRHSASQFAVVPSVEMKLHLLVSSQLRLFVGYDFLYWSQVIRPGNQVDRNINLTQTGTLFSNGGPNGPSLPGVLFGHSDFWTQGITLGFEYRF